MDETNATPTRLVDLDWSGVIDDIEWGDEPDGLACGIENPEVCESCT